MLCFHTSITLPQPTPPFNLILPFPLSISKHNHITLHIPSSPLSPSAPPVTLPSPTCKNNTPRQSPDKQHLSPGICRVYKTQCPFANTSFFVKGDWSGQKEALLSLNFLCSSLLLGLSWPDPRSNIHS